MNDLKTPVYIKDIEDIYIELDSSSKGLSSESAAKRLAKYGKNALPESKKDGYLKIFFKQFHSPLIYVLLVSAVIVTFLKDYKDSIVIVCVAVVNALIGMIQEGKAQNTLVALQNLVDTSSTVLRDGKEVLVSEKDLVPGDIIILQEGDKVGADARIIEATALKVDESAFTGESLPVHKMPALTSTKLGLSLTKQYNMLFKGTNIVYGNAKAIVVSSGVNTEIGKLSIQINKIDTQIPLQANIEAFSRVIIMGILVISAFVFIMGVLLDHTPFEMVKVIVALAVSIIPEGLPVVITLILARGVWLMSKRNALIKKLQAVEALGQANVIAVDKTGTITKNELDVKSVYVDGKIYTITGTGYELEGKVISDKHTVKDVVHQKDLVNLAKVSVFCANAKLFFQAKSNTFAIKGDPTEVAMLVFAEKIGFLKDDLELTAKRKFEIPFDYETKYHIVVNEVEQNGKYNDIVSVAGSPDNVLAKCTKVYQNGIEHELSNADKAQIFAVRDNFTTQGYRVIACATGHTTPKNEKDQITMSFIGFLAMKDTLREEVNKSINLAKKAGIQVVMITGDNRVTAKSIAKDAGIYEDGDHILTAEDLSNLENTDYKNTFLNTSVFAEVTPNDKLKIIEAYRKAGKNCAMTGDGVNDVPSLLAADLSVAMGKIGTEVAKEAADIVLLDDNFESIVAAIEEGRNIYKSILKVIQFLFSTSLAEAALIVLALLLKLPLPLTPTQIIWLNLMTDSVLVLALALEPNEKGILSKKFVRPGKYIIKKSMLFRVSINALIMAIGTLGIFYYYLPKNLTTATTVALTTMVAYQWVNVFNFRSDEKSAFDMSVFKNKLLVISFPLAILMQFLILYSDFFNALLGTTEIKIIDWIIILTLACSSILVEEIRKFSIRK